MAGLLDLGWEVDDVTAYRTVRAAPPPAPTRDAIKTGKFDAVVFTSSSTVRNLVGIAGKPHAVDGHRGDRPGDGQDRRGARAAGRRPGADAVGGGAGRRAGRLRCRPSGAPLLEAGEPVTRPSERRRRPAARATLMSDDAASEPSASRPAAAAASYPCAPPAGRRDLGLAAPAGAAAVRPRGLASRRRSRPCRAWSSTPGTRCARRRPRPPTWGWRRDAVRRPRAQGRRWLRSRGPRGSSTSRSTTWSAEVGDALTVMSDLRHPFAPTAKRPQPPPFPVCPRRVRPDRSCS